MAVADRPDVRPRPVGTYRFGWGTGSRSLPGRPSAPPIWEPIDCVLLSHDHHEDNLDAAGRELLVSAGMVVTTVPGARRLGGSALGLAPWASTRLEADRRGPRSRSPPRHAATALR